MVYKPIVPIGYRTDRRYFPRCWIKNGSAKRQDDRKSWGIL